MLFLSKNCSFFRFLFDRKIPIKKVVWTCIDLKFFATCQSEMQNCCGEISLNPCFCQNQQKSGSVDVLSGHCFNFPALELFDKISQAHLSIQKLMSFPFTHLGVEFWNAKVLTEFFLKWVLSRLESCFVCSGRSSRDNKNYAQLFNKKLRRQITSVHCADESTDNKSINKLEITK